MAPSPASSSSPCRSSASGASSRSIATFVGGRTVAQAPFLIVGFGFGASFVALFAQLGGGIYTKAADVGSDLVGKVEKGIPEDDPRNAGVIADLVGDNVGDCAGRGADLFESTAAENIGAMILGVAVYAIALAAGWPNPEAWIFFPLVVRAFGLLATIVAIFFVRGKETEDPMNILNRGYWVTTVLSVVGLAIVTILDDEHERLRWHQFGLPTWVYFFFAGIVGLATSIAFVYITQYYTAGGFRPVREIAEASKTGPATNIISGTAVGFETTPVTAVAIGIALFASFWLGSRPTSSSNGSQRRRHLRHRRRDDGHAHDDGLHPGHGHLRSHHRQRRRHRRVQPRRERRPRDHRPPGRRRQHHQGAHQGLCDRLRFARRVPAVLGLHRQGQRHRGSPTQRCPGRQPHDSVNLQNVNVFVAALLAAMLAYFFSSLAIRAVGTTAQSIIVEVRRQFREMPGIMDYTQRPDYARVVDITTAAALAQMVLPGLVAVATPIIVGLLLGAEAVAGLLMVGTIAGVLLATVLNNGGGAWDNAKKYIESGNLKDDDGNVLGKGTDAHAAAVVGDTVGDPFKDTAGPSLHVLVKLLATITLVLAPLFIR